MRLRARLAHPTIGFDGVDSHQTEPLSAELSHASAGGELWPGRSSTRIRAGAPSRGEIIELALTRLIDPSTGALPEFFTSGLAAAAGLGIIEPGHQFEWAWLLLRFGASQR